MPFKHRLRITLALGVASALVLCALPDTPQVHAAMPIKALKALQKAAPENLIIDVRRVVQQTVAGKRTGRHITIEVEAVVVSVDRSKAGLQPGDVIEFVYVNPSPREMAAGDWPAPLRPDWRYHAWLQATRGKKQFKPAAHSMSFDDGPMKKLIEEIHERR
ncbi:MAG: hypothetical protein OER86_11450 [Phycisphaerae bacterium]|nr:hypothetical protein [Phycisphaerae bacterium]